MSESQSRYSIVERLTAQKLEIMNEKQNIEGKIESKKQEIKQLKFEMSEAEIETRKELAEKKANIQYRINLTEQDIASMVKGKNTKSNLCDLKIKELDKALKAIADISKSSVEEAKL